MEKEKKEEKPDSGILIHNGEDNIVGLTKEEHDKVHEAKILPSQPYGVYALCKIMEHFKIN